MGTVTLTAKVCVELSVELGEGPVWDSRRGELSWVDILGGRLHRARPRADGLELVGTLEVGCHLGAAVPDARGGWVLAAATGFALLSGNADLRWLSRPEAGRERVIRMNDGACDAAGRFWAGSIAYDNTPRAGSLYCLNPDLSVRRVLGGTTISNGIGWSRDNRTMWFIDSGAGTVDAFDYDLEHGAVSRQRTIIAVDPGEGVPDGLAVDEYDCLWVAIWDGAQVRRYSNSGRLLGAVELPASRPTSCCFGGHDLSTLFITTAREGLTADGLAAQPDAGRLFCVDAGVRGLPSNVFRGAVGAGISSAAFGAATR